MGNIEIEPLVDAKIMPVETVDSQDYLLDKYDYLLDSSPLEDRSLGSLITKIPEFAWFVGMQCQKGWVVKIKEDFCLVWNGHYNIKCPIKEMNLVLAPNNIGFLVGMLVGHKSFEKVVAAVPEGIEAMVRVLVSPREPKTSLSLDEINTQIEVLSDLWSTNELNSL